jgi:hypothetical protein
LSNHRTTPLASGPVNGANEADEIIVELAESPDLPPIIRIRWPASATLCPPAQFDRAVAASMRVLSSAVVELSAIRLWKKL